MKAERVRAIIFGALAGVSATLAMTAAMRRLFRMLPDGSDYPLPPREIVQRVDAAGTGEAGLRTATVTAHFGYGALAGIVYALLPRRMISGGSYGVLVWALSYLGWIPLARILSPATEHPATRNLLMLGAHLVWGASLAASLHELRQSTGDIFGRGPVLDARRPRRLVRGMPRTGADE
ncbi:hypothetical protein ACG873_13280 [Mesorhizobium sp. AaZ16]|uniref:hypothetical protein n=1 Tax=Mesorhizobium sp. AaZ16 TaxID=3402289 RepID=UPI00374F7902